MVDVTDEKMLKRARLLGATFIDEASGDLFKVVSGRLLMYSDRLCCWCMNSDYDISRIVNMPFHKLDFELIKDKPMENNKDRRGIGLKFDAGKPRVSLIPPKAIVEMAKVMTFGAEKYEAHSWRTVENAEERYLDALLRHAFAYMSGERVDPESGLLTLAHIMCDTAFLIELGLEKSANKSD